MSWLNFDSVKDNVSSLTGQISTFTREVLTEGTEEVYDNEVELKIARSKVTELETRLSIQKAEWERCSKLNEELQEKSESSELQIRALSTEYRQQLTEKDNTIKELEQSFSELQRNSFSRTRNDSSSKDNNDIEDVEFLQHQLSNLKHKISTLENESRRWKEAASSNAAEAQLQHIQEQHQQEIASLQDSYSQKIQKLKQKHRLDIDTLEQEKKELEEEIKELQEFSSWDNNQDGNADNSSQDVLKLEIADQKNVIAELEEKCTKAVNNFEKAKDNCLELDVELESTQEKLDELQQVNNELTAKVSHLEKLIEYTSKPHDERHGDDVTSEQVQDTEDCRRSSDASTTGSRESDFVKVDNIERFHDFGCQVTPLVDSDTVVKELDVVKDENISLALEINRLRSTDDDNFINNDGITPTESSHEAAELQCLKSEIDRLASCVNDLLEELDYSKETQREQAIELDCLRQICLIEGEPFDELKALHISLTELGERYADLLRYYRQVRIELHESNERLLSEMQRNHNNTQMLRQEVNDVKDKVSQSVDSVIEKLTSDKAEVTEEITEVNQDVLYHSNDVIPSLEGQSRDCDKEMMQVCMSDASSQIKFDPSQDAIVDDLRAEKAILERTIEGLERKMELLQGQMENSHQDSPRPDSHSPASHPHTIIPDEDSILHEGLAYDDDDQQACESQWQNDQSRIEELEMISIQYEEELKRNEAVRLDWEVEKEALEAAVVNLQHKCKELKNKSINEKPVLVDQSLSTDFGEHDVMADMQSSKSKYIDFADITDLLNSLIDELSINKEGLLDFLNAEKLDLEEFSKQFESVIKFIYENVCEVIKDNTAKEKNLTDQCLRLSQQNSEAYESLAGMNEQLNSLSSEISLRDGEINDIKSQLITQQDIIKAKDNALNETKQELDRVSLEYQALSERVENAENEILTLTESNETLQQDFDSSSQANAALTNEKEQLQSELDKVQFQIDTNETDDSSEISELKAQLSDMKTERENHISMINDRDTNILELQDRYDNVIMKLEEEKELLISDLQEEKDNYKKAHMLLVEKDKECEILVSKINDMSEFTENKMDDRKHELRVDNNLLHDIQQENQMLKFRIADMEEKLIGVANDKADQSIPTRENEPDSQIEQLMDVIRRKDEQLVTLQSESHDFEKIQQSDMSIRDNLEQLSFMEEKATSLEELVKHYSSQVDILKEEQMKMQLLLQEKTEEINELNDKLENVSSRAEAKDHASSLLHSEHQRLLELNNSQGDEIARLREKIHHLQQALEGRQVEHGNQRHMDDKTDHLVAQITALQEEQEHLLVVLHAKDASLQDSKDALDSLEMKYNKILSDSKHTEKSIAKASNEGNTDLNSLKERYEEAMETIRHLEENARNKTSEESENKLNLLEVKYQEALLKIKQLEITLSEAMPNLVAVENVQSAINPEMTTVVAEKDDTPCSEITQKDKKHMDSVNQMLKDTQQERDELALKLIDHENQLNSTRSQHESQLKNLHEGFETSIQSKDADITLLESKLKQAEDSCNQLNNALQQNGVNVEQLESLNRDMANTRDILHTKENEIAFLKTNLNKLQSVIAAGEAALSKIQDDNQQLQKECQQKDELISTLQTTSTRHEQTLHENETEIHRYKVKTLEAEAKATQETQRLRNHLLEIEDTYTKEALLAQQREDELQEKYNKTVSELERTSVLLQQTSQTSHDGMHNLEEQLHLMASQRDNALLQLSKADDKAEESTAALANLQFALEQLQKDKDGRYDLLNEQYEKLLQKSQKSVEEIKRKEAECQSRMQEAALAVQGAQNMKIDSKAKEEALGFLKEQVEQLKRDTSTKDELLRRLKDSSDGKVDKPLIKNLLIGYFNAPETKRSDVVRVIGSLVGFSGEEIRTIGSGAPPSSLAGGWISGILSRSGQANRPNRSSRGNDSMLDPQNQSFSEMFVSFLEQESINSSTPAQQTKSNQLISASMVATSSHPPIMPSFGLQNAPLRNPSVNGSSLPLSSVQGGPRPPLLFPAPGQDIPRVHTSTANSALQSMLS